MQNKELYEKLYELQTACNAHTNITRITSREDFYLKHIEDSLALLPFIAKTGARLIDIGTGAGYPGIPLAAERPDLQVTLNDATLKKVKYLQAVVTELPLPNARAVWERAEKLSGQKEYKGQYDFVTVRAVADIQELIQLSAPFLRTGGKALFMKAKNTETEIAAAGRTAQKNKMVLAEVHKYRLAEMDRAIVVYVKKG